MQKIPALQLPEVFPHPDAIRSFGDNKHSYEPEFWEFQYQIYRYLGRVHEQELITRYQGILRNMRVLISADRHIVPIQSFLSSWYWYRKEHQTRFEFFLRGLHLPIQPPRDVLDNQSKDAPARPRYPNYGDVIFRYGKHEHMQAMVERGMIRIGPDSFYRTLEFDTARADDESEKNSYLAGEYSRITTKADKEIPVIGDIKRTVSGPQYYLLCMSCDWDSQLFADFDADACVVIRDAEKFAKLLETAARPQLEGWYFMHNPVEYFDPYEMPKNQFFDHAMSKDFRFAYQREYRFFWMAMKGEKAVGFRFLELGPLKQMAELHLRR